MKGAAQSLWYGRCAVIIFISSYQRTNEKGKRLGPCNPWMISKVLQDPDSTLKSKSNFFLLQKTTTSRKRFNQNVLSYAKDYPKLKGPE